MSTALNVVQTAHDILGPVEGLPQPEAPASEAIDAARAEVERLSQLEAEMVQQHRHAAEEIAQLEASAGASILDGTDPDALASRIDGLARKMKLVDATITEVRRRRVAAIKAVWSSEAAELRRLAAELSKEADERQVKTDELLKALEDWEGVPYVADTRPLSEDGVLDRTIDHEAARRAPARYGERGPLPEAQLWGATITVVKVPQTQVLRGQASELEQHARLIESRSVETSGYISAATRDELLTGLAGYGAMHLAPAMHKVLPWLEEGEAREAQRRGPVDSFEYQHSKPTVFVLEWRDGELDRQRSYIGPSREW